MTPSGGGGRRRVAGERGRSRPAEARTTGPAADAQGVPVVEPVVEPAPAPAPDRPARAATTPSLTKPVPPGARPRSTGAAASAPPEPAGGRRAALVVAAVALTALLVVAAVVVTVLDRQQQRVDDARTAALEQARTAGETVLSYGYTTLDEDFDQALALSTGQFREDYERTSEGAVRDVATQTEAEVKADVISAGVVSASADRVVVLLFVDQTTVSNRLDRPQTDQNRVRLTMVRSTADEGPTWLVEQVEAL